MTAEIIDGKGIAATIRQELAEEVKAFHDETGVTAHLAAVLVGDDPASAVYVRNKQRACEAAGLKSSLHTRLASTSTEELLELIGQLNEDATVHGILVQLPLPKQIDELRILDAVAPTKDVDAFHPENVGRMMQGRPRFLPCTPHGVVELLRRSDVEVAGAHAVVIGRSEIVGKPMAAMLAQKSDGANATVTICHSRTRDLPSIVRLADIVIAAIGQPAFVTADMVQPGAVVIDVGINRVDNKLVGDVDYERVRDVASKITPVPGGVGPMTIAMVLRNTFTAAKLSVEASGCTSASVSSD